MSFDAQINGENWAAEASSATAASASPKRGLQSIGEILKKVAGDCHSVLFDVPVQYLDEFAELVIWEVSRINNISEIEAQAFIDAATFDEIACCFKNGDSLLKHCAPGLLAQTFCHISTRNELNAELVTL